MPEGQKIKEVEPICLTTANGVVEHNESTKTKVKALGRHIENIVVGECPPVAGMGRLCIDDKMDFIWLGSQDQDPYLKPKGGRKIPLRVENYCPYLDDCDETSHARCCIAACGGAVPAPASGPESTALPFATGGSSRSNSGAEGVVPPGVAPPAVVPPGNSPAPPEGATYPPGRPSGDVNPKGSNPGNIQQLQKMDIRTFWASIKMRK